jgi:hypothetical protein
MIPDAVARAEIQKAAALAHDRLARRKRWREVPA